MQSHCFWSITQSNYYYNSSTVPNKAPQNLRVTKVTTNSVSLKWEAPPLPFQNGAIIGYTIQVLGEDNTTSFPSTLTSREPSLTVTNLDDDTTYDFSVAANTSIGAGPYSTHVTAKTKNYGKINIIPMFCYSIVYNNNYYTLLQLWR